MGLDCFFDFICDVVVVGRVGEVCPRGSGGYGHERVGWLVRGEGLERSELSFGFGFDFDVWPS